MYYLFHALGFLGAAVYMWLFASSYGIARKKAFALTALTYASVYTLMLLIFYLATGNFGGQNIVRIFMFVPPIAVLYGAALNMKPGNVLDLVAPVPCLVHGISHFGCLFPGCCHSWLKVDWGIYNPKVGARLFPLQVFEAVTALVIAAIVILTARKHRFSCCGRTMPLMLLLFGVTRFGWEFLRENEKLFWGISALALWAAATAAVGAIWLCADAMLRRKRSVTR